MQKIKVVFSLFICLLFGLFMAQKVNASVLSIQTLPGYINVRDFKLSCTSDGVNAQFYFRKESGSYSAFGPVIDLTINPCLVQVTSSQVTEETKYYFKVNVDGVDNAETSVIFDNSGPSPISGYYKDGLSDGFRLHYHTPNDLDFDKVKIYRGDTSGFSADSSHEISTINGSPNTEMTYEDHFTMVSGVTYYYYIRALDHAGNSSGLIGDTSTTTQVLGATNAPVSGKVKILPKENGTGTVLGTEADLTATTSTDASNTPAAGASAGTVNWVLTHKKISGGVAIILLGIAYFLYRRSKKNN